MVHAFGHGGDYEDELEKTAEQCPHFYFHGVQDHSELLEKMQSAHVLLNTSTEEGGANAICEAVVIGLPVIASHIDGNIGMLGADYEGFFPSNDAAGLVGILTRAAGDTDFYQSLKMQITARASLFSYQHEADRWISLVRSL